MQKMGQDHEVCKRTTRVDQRMTTKTANKTATTLVSRDGVDDEMAPPWGVFVMVVVLPLLVVVLPPPVLFEAKGSGRPL